MKRMGTMVGHFFMHTAEVFQYLKARFRVELVEIRVISPPGQAPQTPGFCFPLIESDGEKLHIWVVGLKSANNNIWLDKSEFTTKYKNKTIQIN